MFDKIIGNSNIKAYLKNLIDREKVPNTILFSGTDGIGKSLFAKELAYYLMYPRGEFSKFLKNSYKRIEKEIHPDLYVYRPEGKASIHPISSVKKIINTVNLSTFEAKSKVFIIHDFDRMLKVTANAFLKVLEEPNLDSYIILLTSKLESIIPTIVSRCSVLKFSSIKEGDMIELIESWGKTKKEALKIALFSQGSINKASEIASFVDYDDKTKILLDLLSKKDLSYLEFSKKLDKLQTMFDSLEKDIYFKEIEFFLSHILLWIRDLSLLKEGFKKNIFFEDFIFSNKVDLNKAYPSLDKVFKVVQEAKEGISLNVKFKTCLENLFFQLNLM